MNGDMTNPYAIGIDLGGSSVKGVVVTDDGGTLQTLHQDFDVGEGMEWALKIRGFVEEIEEKQKGVARWIGLSAPGLAARNARSIAYLPGRLSGLEGLDWTSYLDREEMVPVLNDGHAALLGEVWLGAARGFENVIMLTLGTGVGGAAIVDGRLLQGHNGKAGHLGHTSLDPEGEPDICGAPGSLEVAIGNWNIERRSGGRFKSTHELVKAYLNGEPEAASIWRKSIRSLAAAICSFTNILDPEAVIVGGGIARAGEALLGPLKEYLEPMEWRVFGGGVRILPAELEELAGAYGAAFNAIRPHWQWGTSVDRV